MDSTKRGHKNRSGGSYRSEATCQLAGAQTIKHTGKRGLNSFPSTPAVIAPTNLTRRREKEEERERENSSRTSSFARLLACSLPKRKPGSCCTLTLLLRLLRKMCAHHYYRLPRVRYFCLIVTPSTRLVVTRVAVGWQGADEGLPPRLQHCDVFTRGRVWRWEPSLFS